MSFRWQRQAVRWIIANKLYIYRERESANAYTPPHVHSALSPRSARRWIDFCFISLQNKRRKEVKKSKRSARTARVDANDADDNSCESTKCLHITEHSISIQTASEKRDSTDLLDFSVHKINFPSISGDSDEVFFIQEQANAFSCRCIRIWNNGKESKTNEIDLLGSILFFHSRLSRQIEHFDTSASSSCWHSPWKGNRDVSPETKTDWEMPSSAPIPSCDVATFSQNTIDSISNI